MKKRALFIGLIAASIAYAQDEDPALEQKAAIARLEAEVERLRTDVADAQAEVRRNEQILRQLLETNRRVPASVGPYTAEIRNAIFDLSDCEQQLIRGDTDDVEVRLVRAYGVLEGSAAYAVEDAIEALLSNDLGEARGHIVQAIRRAQHAY